MTKAIMVLGDFLGRHRDSLGGMKKSTSGDKGYLLDL